MDAIRVAKGSRHHAIRQDHPAERRTRKTVLLLHIVSAAAWFGIDLALGISLVTAMVTSDLRTAGVALQAVDMFAVWPMFAASLLCLTTGVVLGLSSKYGLIRFTWVTVKLIVNVGMSTLIYVALRPGIGEAATLGDRMLAGEPLAVPADLLGPVIVAPTLLLVAFLLSVFKPWGRTRFGRRAVEPRSRRSRVPAGV